MFAAVSRGVAFALLALLCLAAPRTAAALEVREVALRTNDIVFNPTDGFLYASIPSLSGTAPNTVARLDPATGAILTSVPVGSEPRDLAISSDGTTLYVGLDGAGAIRRVDLGSMTAGIQFNMGADSFLGQMYAEDIEVQPGSPNVIVVSLRNAGFSPRHMGVAVFDNGVKRADVTATHTGSNVIVFGATPTRVYGYNNETTEFGFRRMTVSASGITVQDVTQGVITGFSSDIEFLAGRIYATTGVVLDAEARTPLGTFALTGGYANGVVAPTADRTYFAVGTYGYPGSTSLQIFDPVTFVPIERYSLPVTGQPSTLRAAGANRFALRTDGGAHLYVLSHTDEAPTCDLDLRLADSPDPAVTGNPLSYFATIRNLGGTSAIDVTFRQRLPAGTNLSSYSTPRGYCYDSLGTVVCPLGSVAPGDSLTIFTGIVTPSGSSMECRAEVTSSNRDSNPANNAAVETTEIRPAGFDRADIAVRFTAPPDSQFIAGRPVTHSLEIRNLGPGDATHVGIGAFGYNVRSLTFSSPDLSCPDTLGSCEIGRLLAGESARVTATLVPSLPGFLYIQYAAYAAEPDDDYSNNLVAVSGPVRPAAETLLVALIHEVRDLGLHWGPERQLVLPLETALAALASRDTSGACVQLELFLQRLDQRAGRGVTVAEAYGLGAIAQGVQQVLGCIPPPAAEIVRTRGPGPATAAAADAREDATPARPWPLAVQAVASESGWNVRVSMPEDGDARLEILDVQGRVVSSLFTGRMSAGIRELSWDPATVRGFASGVYFFRLTAIGQQRIAKFSMLR